MASSQPRVFISYSWTSKAYQSEVVRLAERLVGDGVDVVIDVWDLHLGNDKYSFMERCVTDETITKVLILCDKGYAEKADAREGGVGDETTVITPEVYGKTRQEKFVPVVMERDADNEPFLPAYLRSRMCVDLSDGGNWSHYDELLADIQGKSRWVKPTLGAAPS